MCQAIDVRTVPDRLIMAQRLVADMLQSCKFSADEVQRRMRNAYADKYGTVSLHLELDCASTVR